MGIAAEFLVRVRRHDGDEAEQYAWPAASKENGRDTTLAQTGRRTIRLGLRPFTIDAEAGRREWRQMLLALEQRVVLTDKHPGMLADDLSDYLFARSTGHIGSLMTLNNRGCQRAVRTGAERLDQELMDQVKNDEASEAARLELQAALKKKRLTSRPRPRADEPHETADPHPSDPAASNARRGTACVPRNSAS
ncbi:hypothetical protein [Streptomyces sp. NPDC012510]|uniref:hypothetical protein n=1 Tax=Streptomyces sp. NPDC012510 TaxID=3364838 RepID=UPI0036DFC934